jgi:N-acetylmuramoyl-L-alanine amidase
MSNGVTEAELVLDVALRLEKLLAQIPGVEVVLTRRTNEYIPLEERTAMANREPRADLFLSIHANSHRQSAVRGIETYFLNFATNPDAEAVAARENAASVQTMGTLPAIVKAIALNNKIEESREFAALLQTSLVRRMRTQTSATRDLGVKQAPFVVLIGAQMPSVLTEIAFLTNRAEASLLKQPTYRQNIAQALRDAIVKYQGSLKRVSTPASQPPR